MPDENTYYWLYNEDMTEFIRFKVKDQTVEIGTYTPQTHHTLEEALCPIEPHASELASIDSGKEIWMDYVRKGWRMMIESIGRIDQHEDMITCWVTLNGTKVNV
tara:strand:+ start:263 stop:574 length:312 start_codon:yes stop_codon:yes gene_type:complete